MRTLLFLFLPAVAFAGDWSDAYRPRVPCEAQANAPKVKCEHCGAACACGECGCAVGQFPRVTAPKCAICGSKCQCVTCGCPKSETKADWGDYPPNCLTCGFACKCGGNCACPDRIPPKQKSAAVETATARTARLNAVVVRSPLVDPFTRQVVGYRDWTVGAVLAAGFPATDIGLVPGVFTEDDRAFLAAQRVVVHPVAVPMPAYAPPPPSRSVGIELRGPNGGGFYAGYQSGGT